MKKMISICILFSMILTQFVAFAKEENNQNLIVKEDFESVETLEDLHENWKFNRLNDIGLENDQNKVLKLGLESGINSFQTKYILNEELKSGLYLLKYSFMPGANLSTLAKLEDSSGNTFVTTFFSPDGLLVSGWASSTHKQYYLSEGLTHEKWYDVRIIIDMDKHTAITEVSDRSGNVWESNEIPFNLLNSPDLADVTAVIFQVWTYKTSQSYIDNISIEKIPIRYDVSSEKIGNNFGAYDNEKMDFRVQNSFDSDYDCELLWKVRNSEGMVVKSGRENFGISGFSTETVSIEADVKRYGLYRIDTELNVFKDGEKVQDTQEKSTRFSKVLSSEPNEKSNSFGFATHIDRYGVPVESIELMNMLGIVGIRDGFSWNATVPSRGEYILRSDIQKGMEALKTNGTKYDVLVLGYGNPRIVEQVDKNGNAVTPSELRVPTTDEDIEAFGEYCAYIAEISKGSVEYYEIWNEYSGSFNIDRADGYVYAKLVKEAYKRIKAVNPDAKIIGLGGVGIFESERKFVREAFEGGMYDYCDVFSIHPYDRKTHAPNSSWLKSMQDLINIIEEYGPRKPIFVTEMGWSSATEYVNPAHPTVDEKTQGRNFQKINAFMQAYDVIDKLYIYDFQEDGTSHAEEEHCFGVVTSKNDVDGPLLAKPAFVATAAMNKFMTGKLKYCSKIELDSEYYTCAYNFEREKGDNVAVIWSDNMNQDISIDLGTNEIDVFDEYGNKLETLYSESGIFDFGLSDELIYVIGKFNCFEKADTKISIANSQLIGGMNDIVNISIEDKLGRNGRIEVQYNSEAFEEIDKNVNMTDGKASLMFMSDKDSFGKYDFVVKVYDDEGRCFYVTENSASIKDPIDVEVAAIQSSESNNKRWEIEVDILNLSNTSSGKGVCRITEPKEFADFCKEKSFNNILAKSHRKIYINLPEMIKKRTVKVKGEVELDSGFVLNFEEKLDFTIATKASKKPKIDGIIQDNEWISGCVCADSIDNIEYVDSGLHKWGGTSDLSIDGAKFMWDEDNFYLMAIVNDDINVKTDTASDLWSCDSIQFTIEDEFNNVANRFDYPFTEIGLSLLKTGPVVYRYSSQYALSNGIVENCKIAVCREGEKLIYELEIPWTELFKPDYKIDPSKIYGFAMIANDNDGNDRWGWINYNEGIGRAKKVELFGKLRLN